MHKLLLLGCIVMVGLLIADMITTSISLNLAGEPDIKVYELNPLIRWFHNHGYLGMFFVVIAIAVIGLLIILVLLARSMETMVAVIAIIIWLLNIWKATVVLGNIFQILKVLY